MEAGSVCGNFFKAWGSPTKKQTINDSSMNSMTLLNNDIHIYKLYENFENKIKILYTQMKLGSMHITLTNRYEWTTTAKVDGRYQVGKIKD